jgi:hypothetical protein
MAEEKGDGFGCQVSAGSFGSHRLTPVILEDFASRKLQSATNIEAADVLNGTAAII